MTEQLKHLLILLGGIAVVLIIIIVFFGSKSSFRRVMSIFLEDQSGEGKSEKNRVNSGMNNKNEPAEEYQKSTSEIKVEMATLLRKSDDRLRIIESTGQTKIVDAYYELIFMTRKGGKLKIECSPEAYEKVPFNQQGSLTYKRNTLVKFKYFEDTIFN